MGKSEAGDPGSGCRAAYRHHQARGVWGIQRPTRADVRWAAIESLISTLGGTVSEGRGSRVRRFLENAGVRP